MPLVVAALLGVLTWSLLEYCVHRWLGHDRRWVRKNVFGREHTRHHSVGDYFAPWWKKAAAALAALGVFGGLGVAIAGVGPGLAYAGGLVGFYLTYEVLHRLEHVWPGVGPYARWARRHHFHHHFHAPQTNHGVTSPLWDIVFGTYARPAVICVPQKLAMRWLVDPQTGAVRVRHAEHYRLRARQSAA